MASTNRYPLHAAGGELANWIDAVLEEGERIRRTEFKLSCYEPYPRQKIFHAAGAEHRERLLIAANRIGKTHSWRHGNGDALKAET